MSQAASQAHAFYRQVAETQIVWTVRDDQGFPTSKNQSGQRAQPFWSSSSRVARIIKNVPAYNGFEPVEISWDDFVGIWARGLKKDGILVGVNWSGKYAVGYDLEVRRVIEAVCAVKGTKPPLENLRQRILSWLRKQDRNLTD